MAMKQSAKQVFVEGRGDGRGLALTDAEVLERENEDGIDPFPAQEGLMSNECGGKPIFAVDDSFSRGRGPGRGHGPEQK